eukprot:scaffold295899_cov32-Tisochrysis_lutea.AAC.2
MAPNSREHAPRADSSAARLLIRTTAKYHHAGIGSRGGGKGVVAGAEGCLSIMRMPISGRRWRLSTTGLLSPGSERLRAVD